MEKKFIIELEKGDHENMKFNKKIALVSAALLFAAPVAVSAVPATQNVEAANVRGIATVSKKSTITLTKNVHFYNKNGKKLSKTATKGGKYTIWIVKKVNGKTYYGTSGLYANVEPKYLPQSATTGTVVYKQGGKTYTVKTKKGKVISSKVSK